MAWLSIGQADISLVGAAMSPGKMRSEEHLAAVEAAGQQTEYLFFWEHQPERDGTAGHGCPSQWWPTLFAVDGVAYRVAMSCGPEAG